jgi:hypothetical protein
MLCDGVMKDEKIKLEEIETFDTLGVYLLTGLLIMER